MVVSANPSSVRPGGKVDLTARTSEDANKCTFSLSGAMYKEESAYGQSPFSVVVWAGQTKGHVYVSARASNGDSGSTGFDIV